MGSGENNHCCGYAAGVLIARCRDAGNGRDEAQRIEYLNPYLVYRREIASVHDWPFDTGIATRLAFYLIIPPLTWICAALIDVAVERFV